MAQHYRRLVWDARRKPRTLPGEGVEDDGSGYTPEEEAFLRECEAYRVAAGKRFLRATDYLKVLLGLG